MTVRKLLLAYLAATILVVVAATGIGQVSLTNSTNQCGLLDGPDSRTQLDFGLDGLDSFTQLDFGLDRPHSPTQPDLGLEQSPRSVPGPDQQPSCTSDDSPAYYTNGGEPAVNPYQSIVSVQYNGDHRCFGTILTEHHVLVPARCLRSIDPSKLKVVYGLTKLGDVCRWTKHAVEFRVNPRWDESGQQWTHDEAVLMVDSPVKIGCQFKAVTLADEGSVFPRGTKGIVYGWSGNGQSELQKVNVDVTDHMRCKHMYNDRVTDDMVCASGPDGQDACESDFGSPLMIRKGNGWLQAGFVIRGPEDCVPFLHLVYWRPTKTFIESAIKEAICGMQPPSYASLPGGLPRITHGGTARPHSWPWMGYIKVSESVLSGAVLLNRWFATAANYVRPGDTLVLGVHSISTSENQQRIRIEKVIKHPRWHWETKSNMIVLVKLSRPVQYNKHIAPVCLPNEGDKTPNGHWPCMITGWGKCGQNYPTDKLQEVNEVPSARWCGEYDYNTMFCGEKGSGGLTNHFDKGAPLMCRNNENNIWTLHGVLITGGYCEYRPTKEYGRVTGMLSWIKKNIEYPGRQVSFKKFDG